MAWVLSFEGEGLHLLVKALNMDALFIIESQERDSGKD